MSVENKIKQLLSKKEQLVEEASEDLTAGGMGSVGSKASASAKKDTSKASVAANAGSVS